MFQNFIWMFHAQSITLRNIMCCKTKPEFSCKVMHFTVKIITQYQSTLKVQLKGYINIEISIQHQHWLLS